MGNLFQRFIYNVSVLAPLALIIAIVWYQQYCTIIIPAILLGVCIIFSFAVYFSFRYAKVHSEKIRINVTDIKPKDGWITVYVITYLIPFASIVLRDFNVVITGVLATLITVIMSFANTPIPNPLLFICGCHFYTVDAENGISDFIFISKRNLRNKNSIKSVKRLFEYLLLDIEENDDV